MEVRWTVKDGYVNHGEHVVAVDDAKLRDADNLEEAIELIEAAVQKQFDEKVSFDLAGRPALEEAIRHLLAQEGEPKKEVHSEAKKKGGHGAPNKEEAAADKDRN